MSKKLSQELRHCLEDDACGDCLYHEPETKLIYKDLMQKAYEVVKRHEEMEEKRMCRCSGECCVCACGGGCLAGNGDDYFIPASKEKVIENLGNNRYEGCREYMIKYLKEKYNFDYIKSKESEEKLMLHKVTVKYEKNKVLEEIWVIRGIKTFYFKEPRNVVIKEQELDHEPTPNEIAQFLSDSKADFVSVVQNYRFGNELPFC